MELVTLWMVIGFLFAGIFRRLRMTQYKLSVLGLLPNTRDLIESYVGEQLRRFSFILCGMVVY